MLEYLLGTYCASNDEAVIEDGLKTVKRVLVENYVRPDEAEKVKSAIREKGSLKIIDKKRAGSSSTRPRVSTLADQNSTPCGTVRQ